MQAFYHLFRVFCAKLFHLFLSFMVKIHHLFRFFCLYKGLHAFLISANLCRGGRRGVWFRVLCGELHSRTIKRLAASPFHHSHHSIYVDRAWYISSAIWFMATHSGRVTWRLEGSYSHGERMRTRPAATASNKPSPGL